MSEHPRDTVGSHAGNGAQAAASDSMDQLITRALRSRDDAPPAVALLVDRIEARLVEVVAQDEQRSTVTHLSRRGGKTVAATVVISALSLCGAGAAAAANPYSEGARTLEKVAHAVGIDWSAMPDGYTRDQWDAFWGAGYDETDVATLGALWKTDALETKAHAGQLILDGSPMPIAPDVALNSPSDPAASSSPATVTVSKAQLDALTRAGYTQAGIDQLNKLWNTENAETKARAGQLILDGEKLPITPS